LADLVVLRAAFNHLLLVLPGCFLLVSPLLVQSLFAVGFDWYFCFLPVAVPFVIFLIFASYSVFFSSFMF